ncbi:MAG: universal stress protein [Salibacteraceae bacterium]
MSDKYKLAVSVDFKDTSRHSFSESLYLAKRGNLEVVIIHINTDPSKTEADFAKIINDMIADNGDAAEGLDITYRIIPGEKGEIVERLARTIDQIDPLYVVVGYEIKHGMERFLGPNIKKIIYETKYPVIALKNMETLKELTTLFFPLTLDQFSRQKTNISIKFCKDMGLKLHLLPLRINNTKKDNVHQEIITKNMVTKLQETETDFIVEWEEGEDEVECVLAKTLEDNTGIVSVVFESSPDFLDNFRTTREERLLQLTEDPLLIVKSHHSPFMY